MFIKWKLIVSLIVLFASCWCGSFAQNKDLFKKYFPSSVDVTGATDYTVYLQKMIDDNRVIVLPNFPVLINDSGITIKSNKRIIFQENSLLTLKPSSKESYEMLRIHNSMNVELINPKLLGDRLTHLSNKGEWGMGISIRGGKNITIRNAVITHMFGDGIYIARRKNQLSDNIRIVGSRFEKNRRNGITIISGTNIDIHDCTFINTDGTLPMAAIDIEPNNAQDKVDRIRVRNIRSRNNGVGVQLGLSRYPESLDNVNIDVINIESVNDVYGLIVGGFYERYGANAKLTGKINFNNIYVANPRKNSIRLARYYKYGPVYTFQDITIKSHVRNDNIERFEEMAKERGIVFFKR